MGSKTAAPPAHARPRPRRARRVAPLVFVVVALVGAVGLVVPRHTWIAHEFVRSFTEQRLPEVAFYFADPGAALRAARGPGRHHKTVVVVETVGYAHPLRATVESEVRTTGGVASRSRRALVLRAARQEFTVAWSDPPRGAPFQLALTLVPGNGNLTLNGAEALPRRSHRVG